MKPWASYCRVSDDDQTKGVSLDVQRESNASFLRSVGNTEIIHLEDDGYSAWQPGHMKRPALQKLVALINSHEIAGVVVWAFDRLARVQRDFIDLVDLLRREGVEFACVTMRIDTTGPWGRFLMQLIASLAELESGRTSDRVKAAAKHIRAKGGFWGGAIPMGTQVRGEKGDKRLEIDPVMGPKMARVWPMVIDGASLRDVAAYLNREVPSRRGKPWAANSVSDYLRLERLVGMLVTRETYDAAQQVLDSRWSPRRAAAGKPRLVGDLAGGRKPKRVYLLAGLAFCAHCGAAMTATYGTGRKGPVPYYRCSSNNRRGKAGCKSGLMPAKLAEEAVLKAVRHVLERDDGREVLGAWEARVRETQAETAPLREELEQVTRERDLVAKKIDRLIASLEDGEASSSRAIAEAIGKRRDELERLQLRIAQVDGRMAAGEAIALNAGAVRTYMLDQVERLQAATPEEQAAGLRDLVRRVGLAVDVPRLALELVVDAPGGSPGGREGRSTPGVRRTAGPLVLPISVPIQLQRVRGVWKLIYVGSGGLLLDAAPPDAPAAAWPTIADAVALLSGLHSWGPSVLVEQPGA